jgi:hypothetical protein
LRSPPRVGAIGRTMKEHDDIVHVSRSLSMIVAVPCPPPTHIVMSAVCLPLRSSSSSAVMCDSALSTKQKNCNVKTTRNFLKKLR